LRSFLEFHIFFILHCRQGVLGIKVKIMLPWDPNGKIGPKKPLPDHVNVAEPKDEPTNRDVPIAPVKVPEVANIVG